MSTFWGRFFNRHRLEDRDGSQSSPDWYERLDRLFRKSKGCEFTFEHLYQKINPPSPEELAAALSHLVEAGRVHQIIRVESPRGKGGVKDYSSLAEIPTELHDWRTDQHFPVQPDDLRVLYTP